MKILIACIGNIFCGDDGFGVEVARFLTSRTLPEGVVLRDFGIRGMDLAYELLDPWDLTILVDACPRGGEAGAVYVVKPEIDGQTSAVADPHGMNPVNVLRLVQALGGAPGSILLVGCEPEDLGPDEGRIGLTPKVACAVPHAADVIESLISDAMSRANMAEAKLNRDILHAGQGRD
jgi:hydrogenase maturation protease